MKRILCCILAVMIFSCGFTTFASTSPTVSIVCPDMANSEETFDVYVSITENSNVGGGRITFGYDNTVLEIVSISSDLLLSGTSLQVNTAYTATSARVSWAGISNLTASGNLLKISFKAKTIYEDTNTTISIEDMKLTDADTNTISGTTANDTILVKAKSLPTFSVECVDEALMGTNIDVNVNISENTLACGGRFNLVYDNTKLEIISTQTGSVLSNATPFVNPNYANNKIRMSWAGTTALTDGGNLLTVTFKVLDNVSGSAAFTLESCKMTDNNDATIQCLAVNKTVQIMTELVCSTETVYSEENGKWKFSTKIKNCPENAILIVAIYNDSSLADLKITDISDVSSVDSYLNQYEFDNAKIFIWESLDTLIPISIAEEISYK